jgi:hypothetical protein
MAIVQEDIIFPRILSTSGTDLSLYSILSMWGAELSLYSVCAELLLAYTHCKLNSLEKRSNITGFDISV